MCWPRVPLAAGGAAAPGSGGEGEACRTRDLPTAGTTVRGPLGKSRLFPSAWGQRRNCPKGCTADSQHPDHYPSCQGERPWRWSEGGWGSFGTPTLRNQGLQPAPDKTSLRTLGKDSPFPSSRTPSYGLSLDWDRDPLSSLSGLSTRNKSEQGSTRHPTPHPILSDKRDCNKQLAV